MLNSECGTLKMLCLIDRQNLTGRTVSFSEFSIQNSAFLHVLIVSSMAIASGAKSSTGSHAPSTGGITVPAAW